MAAGTQFLNEMITTRPARRWSSQSRTRTSRGWRSLRARCTSSRAAGPLLAAAGALFAVGTGCGNDLPDPSQPIVLEVASTIPTAPLEEEAACWNLEFGTQIEVSREAWHGQRVRVWSGDEPCAFGAGAAYLAEPSIGLCSEFVQEKEDLFVVALHETGHILGLGHAEEVPLAVMAPERPAGQLPRFLPADHALFAAANPGFLGSGGCSVIRTLGEARHATFVDVAQQGVFAVWANGTEISFARLDDNTASPVAPSGSVSTGLAPPEWLLAEARDEQLHVFWTYAERLFHGEVDLPSGFVRARQPLEAVALPGEPGRLESLSLSLRGEELWVLASGWFGVGWEPDKSASLQRLDVKSWLPKPLELESFGDPGSSNLGGVRFFWDDARLVVADERLMLVNEESGRLRAHQLRDGKSVQRFGLDSGGPKNHLAVLGGPTGMVAAWVEAKERIALRRVELVRGTGGSANLDLPEPGWNVAGSLALAQLGSALAVVVSGGHGSTREIHTAVLDATTLQVRKPWQRLSAPDRLPAVEPWITATPSGRFLVGWRSMSSATHGIARTRCFP